MRIDQSLFPHGIVNRNGLNFAGPQANHVIKIPARNQFNGLDSEARG
ncbi:MAG: hypothetical protein ACRD4P_17640 [Bryobacteraceae bacterium]